VVPVYPFQMWDANHRVDQARRQVNKSTTLAEQLAGQQAMDIAAKHQRRMEEAAACQARRNEEKDEVYHRQRAEYQWAL
jgi:hypothetical protein